MNKDPETTKEEIDKDQSLFDFDLPERPEVVEKCSGEICESCQ